MLLSLFVEKNGFGSVIFIEITNNWLYKIAKNMDLV